MRVELPRVLSVLVHELRSPLGVIQGYARLLQRQHGADDPDAPLLAAIMEQTARISTLGRQSTDLAQICARDETAARRVPLAALCADVAARVTTGAATVTVNVAPDLGDVLIQTIDPSTLASACSALVDLTVRDGAGAPATLTAADADAETVTLVIAGKGPDTPAVPGVVSVTNPGGSGPLPVAFDRGGQGLALVIASYVFDAEHTTVVAARPGVIEIRLRKFRGPQ